jgi:hypothetical protein
MTEGYSIPQEHLQAWTKLKSRCVGPKMPRESMFYDEYLERLCFGPLDDFLVCTPASVGLGWDCGTPYERAMTRFHDCLHGKKKNKFIVA